MMVGRQPLKLSMPCCFRLQNKEEMLLLLCAWLLGMSLLVAGTPKKGVCLYMKAYHCNDTQALHDISWW